MNGENIKDLEKSKTDNVFVGCFFFFWIYDRQTARKRRIKLSTPSALLGTRKDE